MTLSLFTSQQFKDYVGIGVATYDTQVAEMVTRMTAAVERLLCRPLEDTGADVTEYYDGSGTDTLRVRRFPIYSVTSVHVDALRSFDSTSEILSGDRITDKDAGLITLISGTTDLFGVDLFERGKQNVRVIYRGGYKTTSPAGNSLPADMTLGALIWASAIWQKRKDHGLLTTSLGTISDTFAQISIPAEAFRILSPYRAMPTRSGFGT